jgi:hypothetical protein
MHRDPDLSEYDEHQQRLFALLPRESDVSPADADPVVDALRADGFFRARSSARHWWVAIAAGIVVATGGGFIGARLAMRHSLEAEIGRSDLTVEERIILLQRAGSAYVRAAQGYAGATGMKPAVLGGTAPRQPIIWF